MPHQGSIFTAIGRADNLIAVFDLVLSSSDQTDERWMVSVFILVRYEFKGNWEPEPDPDPWNADPDPNRWKKDPDPNPWKKGSDPIPWKPPFLPASLRQMEFRDKFEKMISYVWSPEFSLYGMERTFMIFQKTVRCWVDFSVVNVEGETLGRLDGTGWSLERLKKIQHPIATIEVYPGRQSGAHFDPIFKILRIGEDLSLVTKKVDVNDTSPEKQIDAAHEIGHALGFHHPVCPGNEDRCYGAAGTAKSRSIMGSGMDATSLKEILFTSIMASIASDYEWSIWTGTLVSRSHMSQGRRDGFTYPTSAANPPGPLGSVRMFG